MACWSRRSLSAGFYGHFPGFANRRKRGPVFVHKGLETHDISGYTSRPVFFRVRRVADPVSKR